MIDDSAPEPTTGPRCPWCSAELPSATDAACPLCGATLVSDAETAVPGVTALDAEAIIRSARNPTPQRRSRLLSWISGEYEAGDEDAPATPGSLAPPPLEVQREMLRLELEAEVANLQAEADALVAEAAVEAQEEGVDVATAPEADEAQAAELDPAPAAPAPAAPEDDAGR